MTLNINGPSYFDNNSIGYNNQNARDVMSDTGARAVLYVFKPYQNQFNDVSLRPFQYNFDENFVDQTQEITDLAKRGTARHSSLLDQFKNQVNLSDHMIPSFMPTMTFKASLLSDKWRFILVLTESARGLISSGTIAASQSNSQVRRIYTGYFEDEPFNPTTFSTNKRTLNPNSYLVITHKTIVGVSTEMAQLGARTSVNMQASEEFVHPQLSAALMGQGSGPRSNSLYLMTPENCINSIETNGDGFSLAIPGAHSNIIRDKGVNVVPDYLEQTGHNVSQILRGMMRFQDDVTHNSRLTSNRVDNFFDESFGDDSIGRMKLGKYMSLPRMRNTSAFDLDVDRRISPVDLDNMVGHNLQVVNFVLDRPEMYETANQREISITNQYSFLIASVISPILNSAGLNAMQFEFQIANIRGQIIPDFITHSAEPNWPVPTQDLISMAKAVEVELTNGIFKTIFDVLSDFHVAVSANVTGMTIVRLNLVGQGYARNQQDFELPSCMGGLVSPLLGDDASNAHNSEAIETLYNVATGTQNVSRNFNSNDHDFSKHAEGGSWQDAMGFSPDWTPEEMEIH